jgi:hypothetical protein
MWYVKNVPAWERIVRFIAGVALAAYGLTELQGGALGWVIAVSGAVFALTGTVGFCPMCAMVGRKIATKRDRTLP